MLQIDLQKASATICAGGMSQGSGRDAYCVVAWLIVFSFGAATTVTMDSSLTISPSTNFIEIKLPWKGREPRFGWVRVEAA